MRMQGFEEIIGFDEIKGQRKAVEMLQKSFSSGHISHAYLFHGPYGVGKMKAALIFARLINCENPRDGGPCGLCSSCRKISSGNHPDVLVIKPDGASVKIGQMRLLQEKASYLCYEGKIKVIIIDDAHLLTTEAANSLLKILEEPPALTVFVLLTRDTKNLPVTILSRCCPIPFSFLEDETIAGILAAKGLGNNLPFGLAQGSAGRAIELLEKPVYTKLYREIAELYEKLPELSRYDLLKWVEEFQKEKDRDRELLDFTLDILTFLYRESMIKCLHAKPDIPDRRVDQDAAFRCAEALLEINRTCVFLRSNVNSRLAIEVLLLNLRNMSIERGA